MTKMDKNKKERIIGLVLGLICFLFLFYFNFERWEFTSHWRYRDTIMGQICYGIIRNFNGGSRSGIGQVAENFWWITQVGYCFLIWYYRTCIGHWTIKSMRVFYKKI